MDKMCEHDKREIENLIRFKQELLRQSEEEKDLTYEQQIRYRLKRWKGEQ